MVTSGSISSRFLERVRGKSVDVDMKVDFSHYLDEFEAHALIFLRDAESALSGVAIKIPPLRTAAEKFGLIYRVFLEKELIAKQVGGEMYQKYNVLKNALDRAHKNVNLIVNGVEKTGVHALEKIRQAKTYVAAVARE